MQSDSSSTIGPPSTVNMLNDKLNTRDYLETIYTCIMMVFVFVGQTLS